MNERIAISVGYCFAIVEKTSTNHISLKKTDTKVFVDGESFDLYKGVTYEDSRKVDEILDRTDVQERDISQYTKRY